MFVYAWMLTLLSLYAEASKITSGRPFFTVPSLTEIRTILSLLEPPIISTLTQRFALTTDSAFYASTHGPSPLLQFIKQREQMAEQSGRYAYGTLEYPFVTAMINADEGGTEVFPPGRFHEDSFSGNDNITDFYVGTLVPFFNGSTSFFFHLSNTSLSSQASFSSNAHPDANNTDSVLSLDTTLLQLLSHRAHIGKVVAESKFAQNSTLYTPLIQSKDSAMIRVLLTNTTQEQVVLQQADDAAVATSTAWNAAGGQVSESAIRATTAKLFRELIDITTEIEVQYLLARLH